MGGGALMDIGCYPISLSRFLFGGEPVRVMAHIELDPTTQVDRLTSAVLEFAAGTATFTCGTQIAPYQRVNIFGTPAASRSRFRSNAAARPAVPHLAANGAEFGPAEEIRFDVCNQYTLQADAFARAILDRLSACRRRSPMLSPTCVSSSESCASAGSGTWA